MELRYGLWVGYKMAVRSARSGRASQQGPVCLCHSDALTHALGGSIYPWNEMKKLQKRKHLSECQNTSQTIPQIHVSETEGAEKINISSMSQRRRVTQGSGQGFGCRSNTAHRLGKYHVLSTAEVPLNMGCRCRCCCCHGQPAIKQQNLTQDPSSGLPDQICIVTWRGRALFLDRHPDNQHPLKIHTNTIIGAPRAHAHAEKVIYCPPCHKIPPSGENESVAFFPSSEQKEKKAASFTETCSKPT